MGQSPSPQRVYVLSHRANKAPSTLWVSVSCVFLSRCHLYILGQNPQPLATDLEHGEDSEPFVPGAQPHVFAPPWWAQSLCLIPGYSPPPFSLSC